MVLTGISAEVALTHADGSVERRVASLNVLIPARPQPSGLFYSAGAPCAVGVNRGAHAGQSVPWGQTQAHRWGRRR